MHIIKSNVGLYNIHNVCIQLFCIYFMCLSHSSPDIQEELYFSYSHQTKFSFASQEFLKLPYFSGLTYLNIQKFFLMSNSMIPRTLYTEDPSQG